MRAHLRIAHKVALSCMIENSLLDRSQQRQTREVVSSFLSHLEHDDPQDPLHPTSRTTYFDVEEGERDDLVATGATVRQAMYTLIRQKNGFTVIRVVDTVDLLDDISELRALVDTAVENGSVNIAMRFTKDSALRSAAMAKLVLCAALVNSRGGIFALIAPGEHILSLLRIFNAEELVMVVDSEDDLTPITAQTHAAL